MTRLVNDQRDRIISQVVKDQFAKEVGQLERRSSMLALRVYNHTYNDTERRNAEALDDGWLNTRQEFQINAGGYTVVLNSTEWLRVKHADRSQLSRFTTLTADTKLCQDVQAFANDKEDMKKRREAARTALRTLLYAVNTFEQLEASWPEGKKWIKANWPADEKRTLPAVQVKAVNEMLGLAK